MKRNIFVVQIEFLWQLMKQGFSEVIIAIHVHASYLFLLWLDSLDLLIELPNLSETVLNFISVSFSD